MKKNEDAGVKHFTFKIDEIKSTYDKEMEYAVPGVPALVDGHKVSYDLILDEERLENLPVIEEDNSGGSDEDKENDESEENSEEKDEGEESENETTVVEPLADGAYEISYTTEGADLSRYYEDQVIVIVDGDKQYLQLQGTGMRQFVEYLYIDGQRMEVSKATNEQGAYIAQIELDKKVEEYVKEDAPLTFDMVINAMGRIMAHGLKITLDLSSAKNVDSAELIEGVPSAENEIFVTSTDSISYEYDSGDVDLSSYYEDTINVLEKDGKQYIEFKGTGMVNFIEALYVDGEKMAIQANEDGSYIAQVEHDKDLEETFKFTMIINARGNIMSHSADIKLIIPGEEPKEEPKEDPKEDPKEEIVDLTPDKAYKIMYQILHEDGNSVSVADGFFKKPGILLEHEGKTYLQMTVESADMIKSLSNEYGDYLTVADHKDGSRTIQLRVPNDLSDMKLDMHIVVPAGAIPGFPGYDEEHGAILTFDKDSKKEISVEGLEVTPSGNKNNLNGPYVEGAPNPDPSEGGNNGKQPDKPELGENGDDKKGEKTDENPKTGDTSQILFFSTLLVASLGVLVLQVRRRLAA